ncbi:hypothetical protein D6D22_08557 [Aureobasidium pullulans]|uniref:Uncharacterized protein n=1 Tax=Aureobasidium pullulans TaxID=5580 RepID=A0A4S8XBH5_AURPU|nr:hypothetical protein D6D22_08557 [Aureobasidium pullulans]
MSAVSSIVGAFGQATKNGVAIAPSGNAPTSTLIGAVPSQIVGDDLKYNGVLATASKKVAPSVDTAQAAAPLIEPCINSWYAYLTQGPSGSIDWAKCEYPQEDAAVKVQKPHELTILLTNAEQHEKSVQLGDRKPNEQLRGAVAKKIKTTRSTKIESDLASDKTPVKTIRTWRDDMKGVKATERRPQRSLQSIRKLSKLRSRYSKLLQTASLMYNKTSMKFKGLVVEGQTLEKVKEILVGCMVTLVQLKVQIDRLKGFLEHFPPWYEWGFRTKSRKSSRTCLVLQPMQARSKFFV